jgi:hypothetical protein
MLARAIQAGQPSAMPAPRGAPCKRPAGDSLIEDEAAERFLTAAYIQIWHELRGCAGTTRLRRMEGAGSACALTRRSPVIA